MLFAVAAGTLTVRLLRAASPTDEAVLLSALAIVAVLVVTNRVLSPQYVLWFGAPITVTAAAGATVTTQHETTGAPFFADAANNDYHLGQGSAALNRGLDAGVTADRDGYPREVARPGRVRVEGGADAASLSAGRDAK